MDTDTTESSPPGAPCRHCGEAHPSSFSHCPRTGQSLTAGRALIGRVIANRYRVLSLIDEGGMGAVYVAEHLLIGRKVALKRLHPELTGDEKAIARFQREARTAAATGHEHIVEILDLGFGEDGAPFLVMEYLRGRSLARLLSDEPKLDSRRACRIVGQVLAALAAVHARGIVHRDLKPDNIILTRRRGDSDFVKVVDFGISKVQADGGGSGLDLTRTGVMLGTPFYMSPEQARGVKSIDHRVDLFGAGVILYELLTASLPFDGENYHQLLQSILSGDYEPACARRPDLGRDLSEVVDKAIAIDPNNRFQTAREMLLALVPFGAVDPGAHESEAPPRDSRIPRRFPSSGTHASLVGVEGRPRIPTLEVDEATPTPTPGGAPTTLSGSRPRGLVPQPSTVSPSPRHFLAQSDSWRDAGDDIDASEDVRERRSSYRSFRRQPRQPLSTTGRPATTTASALVEGAASDVKASLVLSALEQLRRIAPDAIRRVSARLDPEMASRISGVMLPMAWVRLSDYVELLRAAERELGAGDGIFTVRLGRAAAEQELGTTHRLFMQSATPTMAVERIPKVFRTYHSGGSVVIERASAGGYRIRAEDLEPDTLNHALLFSGFFQRMIELTGGRDVRASVVSCRERGDDATVTIVRWR